MRALVVYESMYGNTHAIAEAIAEGMRPATEVRVVPVAEATAEQVAWAELIVAGGPTHIHGMTSAYTRKSAREDIAKPGNTMTLDPAASGPGLREWLATLPAGTGRSAAAFDTRIHGPGLLTGRASAGIAKGLRSRGYRVLADPESFFIDTSGTLRSGEIERARAWGGALVPTPVAVG